MPTDYIPNGYTNYDAISWGTNDLKQVMSALPDGRLVFVHDLVSASPTELLEWSAGGKLKLYAPQISPVAYSALPSAGNAGRLAYVTSGAAVGWYYDDGSAWVRLLSDEIPTFTYATLPVTATAGQLCRLSDNLGGIWMYTGTKWFAINPVINVTEFATVSAALTAASAISATVLFPAGAYTITAGNEWTWPDNVNGVFEDAVVTYTLPLDTAGSAVTLGSNVNWFGRVSFIASVTNGNGAVDTTGDTTSGSAIITGMDDTSDFHAGDTVLVSAGFPATTLTILSVDSATQITLSANATSTQSNVTVRTPAQEATAVYAQNESNIFLDHVDFTGFPMGVEFTNVTNFGINKLTGTNFVGQYHDYVPKGSVIAVLACTNGHINTIQGTNVWKAGVYFSPTTRLDSLGASLATTANSRIHINSVNLTMNTVSLVSNGIGFSSGYDCQIDSVMIKNGLYGVYVAPPEDTKFIGHPDITRVQFGMVNCIDQNVNADAKGVFVRANTNSKSNLHHVQFGQVITRNSGEEGVYVLDISTALDKIYDIKFGQIDTAVSAQEGIYIDGATDVKIGMATVANVADNFGIHIANATRVTIGDSDLEEIAEYGVYVVGSTGVRLPATRFKNIARLDLGSGTYNDDGVYINDNCKDCEIGSIWGETTSGHAHDKCLRTEKLSDYACRVTGSIYSTGGGSSDLVAIGDQGFVTIRNGQIYDDAGPTTGTWQAGKQIWKVAPASGASPGLICTASGTLNNTYSQAGTSTTGSPTITGLANTTTLLVGMYVSVSAGFASTGPFLITGLTGTTITVDATANASASLTVTTPNAVFTAMANLA